MTKRTERGRWRLGLWALATHVAGCARACGGEPPRGSTAADVASVRDVTAAADRVSAAPPRADGGARARSRRGADAGTRPIAPPPDLAQLSHSLGSRARQIAAPAVSPAGNLAVVTAPRIVAAPTTDPLEVPTPAHDCEGGDCNYAREGTFPTMVETLSGSFYSLEYTGDLDGDGRVDSVLSVQPEGGAYSDRVVVVRHLEAGYRATVLDVDGGGFVARHAVVPPFAAGGHVYFGNAVDWSDSEGDEHWSYQAYVLRAFNTAGEVVEVFLAEPSNGGPWAFSTGPAGTVLITSRDIGPPAGEVVSYALLAPNATSGMLEFASCWTPAVPTGVATLAPIPACPARAFHLRTAEVLASRGMELPARTGVEVLAQGALTRGASRMFCVRTSPTPSSNRQMGYMFLSTAELGHVCPPPDARAP